MEKRSLNSGEDKMIKLSTEQLERLSGRVFQVLKQSGYVSFDYQTDERVEEKVMNVILDVLVADSNMEDRLVREAERLVQQQNQIAKASGKSFDDLVDEVKTRLAKSKHMILDDTSERSDALAEKMTNALWKIDSVDFFVDNFKVQNCIARAIHRFRLNDDLILEAVEKITSKKSPDIEPYTHEWCISFDKNYNELLDRIAQQKKSE
jgi:hypothetical protein